MSRILITGATGYLGGYLSLSLGSTHDIIKYDRINFPMEIDSIIHCAGLAHDFKGKYNFDDFYDVNTVLTKRILNEFLDSSASTFIYISSIKSIANEYSFKNLKNDDKTPPYHPYGLSKRLSEINIAEFEERLKKLKKQVFIIRPCMIYGGGKSINFNKIVKLLQIGIPLIYPDKSIKRSYTNINLISDLITKILKKPVNKGGIIKLIVCDQESVNFGQLLKMIKTKTSGKSILIPIPKWIGGIFHFIGQYVLPVKISNSLSKILLPFVSDSNELYKLFDLDPNQYCILKYINDELE